MVSRPWCQKLGLCASCQIKSWRQNRKKRTALLLSQAKEDASGSGHPNQGGSGEELYTNGSRMGMLIRLGCAQGLHSFNLASGGLSLEWRMLTSSICCCFSVTQLCLTLCDPMDDSMSGLPVLHPHLELPQTRVQCADDAIHPSCPLRSPSRLAFNLS